MLRQIKNKHKYSNVHSNDLQIAVFILFLAETN